MFLQFCYRRTCCGKFIGLPWPVDSLNHTLCKHSFQPRSQKPQLFSLLSPAVDDTLWSERVEFSWKRAVGANDYLLQLFRTRTTLFSKNLPVPLLFLYCRWLRRVTVIPFVNVCSKNHQASKSLKAGF